MKTFFLLGLALFLGGMALIIIDDRVLMDPEERALAHAERVAIGGAKVIVVTPGVKSLDAHFITADVEAALEMASGGASRPLQARVLNEKPWGTMLNVRTTTLKGVPVSVSNMDSVRIRIEVMLPDDLMLVGEYAYVVLTGMVGHPTASLSGDEFNEEVSRFAERRPVRLVAAGDETGVPMRPLASVGVTMVMVGFFGLAGASLVTLFLSIRASGGGSGAGLRTTQDLLADVAKGGRFVCFQYAISVVLVTFRRASGVYYIPSGGSAFIPGFKWSVLTFLVGWWGIPWGPIYSIGALFRNLRGGVNVTDSVMAAMLRAERPADSSTPPAIPASGSETAPDARAQGGTPPPIPGPPPPR